MIPKKNAFDHCAEMLRGRELKLCDFNINLCSIRNLIFGQSGFLVSPSAMNLLRSTRDLLRSSSQIHSIKFFKLNLVRSRLFYRLKGWKVSRS